MSFEDHEKTVYECVECNQNVENPKENNEGEPVCINCYVTTLDDINLPVWIEMESYNDNYELWDAFWRQTGVDEIDSSLKKEMKYAVFYVWYKITEDGVEGPYDKKKGELMYE